MALEDGLVKTIDYFRAKAANVGSRDLDFQLFPIDDQRQLFISPAIEDWATIAAYGVDTVIDLEGGLDHCIPTVPNTCLYIYFPIFDEDLPTLPKLKGIAKLGAVADSRRSRRAVPLRDGLQPIGARGRPHSHRARHAGPRGGEASARTKAGRPLQRDIRGVPRVDRSVQSGDLSFPLGGPQERGVKPCLCPEFLLQLICK